MKHPERNRKTAQDAGRPTFQLDEDAIETVRRSPDRSAAVDRTGLVGSNAEEAFDRLTRAAMRVTGAPISFFSVVAEDHDYFKSCYGFSEPLASTRKITHRSFCHIAIMDDRPLVIPDTKAAEAYRDMYSVKALGVAAYLGIPMKFEGQRIGSFCVVDLESRPWTEEHIMVLVELAESTLREIKLRAEVQRNELMRLQRDQVIRSVTQKLRDPLTIAKLSLDLLEDEPLTEQGRERLHDLGTAAKRMAEGISESLRLLGHSGQNNGTAP